MAKDLTNSRLDRQNILNNEIAVEEIQLKSGVEGITWNGKIYVTREMTANFFEVDMRINQPIFGTKQRRAYRKWI